MTYEEYIKNFLAKAQKLVPDKKKQAEITRAGAEVYQKSISDTARQLHYTDNRDTVHLADDVHVVDGDIFGNINGTTTVGFKSKGHIARFLNDGTKFRKGDHWLDVAVVQAKPKALAAMAKKFEEVINE